MRIRGSKKFAMHKYWGKKPAEGINFLIDKYSKEGDIILDPFAGYGGFCCEAYLDGRNVIVNDLNPIANFIAKNLFSEQIDIQGVKTAWINIKTEFEPYVKSWYEIEIDGDVYFPISILRQKDGLPLQFSYRSDGKRTMSKEIPLYIATHYQKKEQDYEVVDWYPKVDIIENSRISARQGMQVKDLFTKRTLACHARLLALINKHSSGAERDLLLLSFTANLANCSRLVPPIKSRGSLAQGAWMTGFYIANSYIENNVLHYYENRLCKTILGKEEYLNDLRADLFAKTRSCWYSITSDDAKSLSLKNESVDYVFADPPYGDSVPYFEQSVIWNSWLQFSPNYEDEIVVSDSNVRQKDIFRFEADINKAFAEIRRVLKSNHYFTITFHSLSGKEWRAVSNACVFNNFIMVSYQWLQQKTCPPRQLNRSKTIKGDVLVTFKKNLGVTSPKMYSDGELSNFIIELITDLIELGVNSVNGIIMSVMERILREMIVIGEVDIFKVLNNNFVIDEQGRWQRVKTQAIKYKV